MLFFRKVTALSAIAVVGFTLGTACSSDSEDDPGVGPGSGATSNGATSSSGGTVNLGGDGAGDATGSGGDATGTGNGGADGGKIPVIDANGDAICGDHICQCSDGEDNDGDMQPDGLDVECQGPLDDDEGSFATGLPGDNKDSAWMDCFFDGDSGAGNDGCKYKPGCLTGDIPQDSPDCEITPQCLEYCAARTPNGCDCFGCCTIQLTDGPIDILTTTGCDYDNIDDEQACPRCTKTTACGNDCGECELCPGKTEADLPPSCTPDPPAGGAPSDPPPVYTCEGGDVCGDNLPCDAGYYCSLGCCLPVVK